MVRTSFPVRIDEHQTQENLGKKLAYLPKDLQWQSHVRQKGIPVTSPQACRFRKVLLVVVKVGPGRVLEVAEETRD
jgi:hypothetical protein